MYRPHSRLLAAAAAALLAAGCAQDNGDISYVQPNYTKKADLLDGVWYFRNVVTDTPPTTGFTFTGETGELEKIVWDVQEGHLIGFRAYPQIPGADGNIEEASRPSGTTTRYCKDGVCTGGHKYYGNPVVAYPIDKHFDIQRGYSTTTGEQTNVINENSSDRPWNEREYIRVNWTAEILNVGMGAWGIISASGSNSNISSWIHPNEPGTDPYDWPRQEFEDVNGEAKLKYFEFTGRHLAKPDTLYYPGYGEIPFCWLSQRYDCTAQEIHVRTSVAKIDPNKTRDYEPLVYDNDMMAKFGYFRTERINYDRRFGSRQSDVIFIANRHRIWESSFQRDGAGNVDWSKPIPFAQRTPKPIVYYVPPANRMGGADDYKAYMAEAKKLEAGWDKAFRRAVAAARTGSDASWESVPQMLYVCDNPVPAGAPAACGQPGFEARFGDLRYNFIWTIPEAVPNGLLGYGPSSADPETGEIISANANTYSAAVALQAQHTLDVVKVLFLNDDNDTYLNQVIRGADVRDYMQSRPSYANAMSRTGRIQSELQGAAVQRTNEVGKGAFLTPTQKFAGALTRIKGGGGLPIVNGDRFQAMADQLAQHPQLESVLLDNAEVVDAAKTIIPVGAALDSTVSSGALRDALRGVLVNPDRVLSLQDMRLEYASRRNIYLVDFFQDNQLLSVAYKEGPARADKIAGLVAEGVPEAEAVLQVDDEIRWRFRGHIWRATSEHEIGHTFGLRHNFQGSFDAINYFDGYWDLKRSTLTVDQTDQTGQTRPVVPRTPADLKNVSDGTEDQLYGGIYDYEYSSIMDYGGKSNADWQGVGKYDEAAILFAYSGGTAPGYVEVFDAPLRETSQGFFASDGTVVEVTGAAYDLPVVNALKTNTAVPNYTERFHYSTVPLHFGNGSSIQEVIDDGLLNMRIRSIARWADVKAKYDELRRDVLSTTTEPTPAQVAAKNVPLEVPYMFCTDDHVGYILSCHRWDRGPDYYEINKTWLESYWNNYFFNHFRRDRYEFSAANAFYGARTTFRNSSLMYRHWVWANFGAKGANTQKVPNYTTGKFGYDLLMQHTWSMAALDSVNNLLRVLSVPSTGFYMLYEPSENGQRAARWDLLVDPFEFDELSPQGQKQYMDFYGPRYGAQAFAYVRRGESRPMYSRYDNKAGAGYHYRIEEIGHTMDQIGALASTLYSGTPFMGADIYADTQRFYIPYNLVFRDEMHQTFGNVWAAAGDCVSCTAGGEALYRPTVYLKPPDPVTQIQEPVIHWPVHVYGGDYLQQQNGSTLVPFDYPKREDVSTKPAAAPVNVTTTWTARVYSLLYGMVGFQVNYDLDFNKMTQVIRVGSGEDVTVPAGWEKVEVQDGTTGLRYAALKPVGSPDTSAVRMVKMAKESWANSIDPRQSADDRALWAEDFNDKVRDLELMRGFNNIFGSVWMP